MALIGLNATLFRAEKICEEICENLAKTRCSTRVSAVGLVTFTRVSGAAVTAEPYHFLHVSVRFQLKENKQMYPQV